MLCGVSLGEKKKQKQKQKQEFLKTCNALAYSKCWIFLVEGNFLGV